MRKNSICLFPRARKEMPFVLAIFWFLGLLCGVIWYVISSKDAVSLMRGAMFCAVSIVGLPNAVLIPFLLSALFTAMSVPEMLVVICFFKACSFSFVSLGLLLSMDSGGWLLRCLLLFGDCTMMPLLYWYWLRSLTPSETSHRVATGFTLFMIVLVAILNYCVIAPALCA